MENLERRIEEGRKAILNQHKKETINSLLKTAETIYATYDAGLISSFGNDVGRLVDKYSNKRFPGSKTGSRYNLSPSTTLDYEQFESQLEEFLKKPGFVIYGMIADKLSIPKNSDKEARSLFRRLVQEQNLSSERAGRRTAFYRGGERPESLSVGEAVRKILAGKDIVPADEIYRELEGTYNPHEIRGALSKTDYRLNRDTNQFERMH